MADDEDLSWDSLPDDCGAPLFATSPSDLRWANRWRVGMSELETRLRQESDAHCNRQLRVDTTRSRGVSQEDIMDFYGKWERYPQALATSREVAMLISLHTRHRQQR